MTASYDHVIRILPGVILALAVVHTPAGAASKTKSLKLVMLGDSVTLSHRSPAGSKLTDCVGKELNALSKDKPAWEVVNAGKGSETAAGGRTRAKAILDKEKPDLVTIAYGLNDTGRKDPAWFQENLKALVDLVRTHPSKPQVLLITATPFNNARHAWGKQPAYVQAGGLDMYLDLRINHETRLLADKEDLPLCDLHCAFADTKDYTQYLLADGVHPNDKGNAFAGAYVARCIWAFYQGHVKRTSKAKKAEKKALSELKKLRRRVDKAKTKDAGKLLKDVREAYARCPYLPQGPLLLDKLMALGKKETPRKR